MKTWPFLLFVWALRLPSLLDGSEPLVLIPTDHESAQKLKSIGQKNIKVEGATFKLVPLSEVTRSSEKLIQNFVIPNLELKQVPLSDTLNFVKSIVTDIEIEDHHRHINFVAENIPEPASIKINYEGKKVKLETFLQHLAKVTDAEIKVAGYQVKLVGKSTPSQKPGNYSLADFAGDWVSLPFHEMAREDLPAFIKDLRDGSIEGPNLSEEELKEFHAMSDEELTTVVFDPIMKMFEQIGLEVRMEITPPNEVWFEIASGGQQTLRYGIEKALFEMKNDEIHIRDENEITIIKIVDKDTLKTPNEKYGAIPRWITFKRKK